MGLAVRDGLTVAVFMAILVSLAVFCVYRAKRRWPTSSAPQRMFALATAVASCALVAWFLLGVGTSPTLARTRSVRALQSEFGQEERFSDVRVAYVETKIDVIWVEGSVRTEADFRDLRGQISSYDWRDVDGIYWAVRVIESKQMHEGWDKDLFGEGKRSR